MNVTENPKMYITISALLLAITATIWGCGGDEAPTTSNKHSNPPSTSAKTPPSTMNNPQAHHAPDPTTATPGPPGQDNKVDSAEKAVDASPSVVATPPKPTGSVKPAEATAGGMQPQDTAASDSTLAVGGIDQPGGIITGIIRFAGEQKKQHKQSVAADPFCAGAHKDHPLLQETYVFGKNNTLQNVLVYISKGLEGKQFEPPAQAAVLDQRGCAYTPHVIGVVVNQTLEIRNSDQTLHNVKLISKKNGKGNNAIPAGGIVLNKTFKKPELKARYKCDVHPWMKAYLHVMPHPFFAITQSDGTFMIKGVPPGNYEVSVWHELDAFQPDNKTVSVEVTEDKTVPITIIYSPTKKKKT